MLPARDVAPPPPSPALMPPDADSLDEETIFFVGVPRSLGDRERFLEEKEGEELTEPRSVGFVLEQELELRSRKSLRGRNGSRCEAKRGGNQRNK